MTHLCFSVKFQIHQIHRQTYVLCTSTTCHDQRLGKELSIYILFYCCCHLSATVGNVILLSGVIGMIPK